MVVGLAFFYLVLLGWAYLSVSSCDSFLASLRPSRSSYLKLPVLSLVLLLVVQLSVWYAMSDAVQKIQWDEIYIHHTVRLQLSCGKATDFCTQHTRILETKSSRLCLHPQSHSTCECGVALAGKFFGEDSERLVRKFRDIGPGTGRQHVARSTESRFQIDIATTEQQQIYAFHETFCNSLEKRLEKLPGYDAGRRPKMSFRYKNRRYRHACWETAWSQQIQKMEW